MWLVPKFPDRRTGYRLWCFGIGDLWIYLLVDVSDLANMYFQKSGTEICISVPLNSINLLTSQQVCTILVESSTSNVEVAK